MTGHSEYFAYLRRRSRLGWLYRRYWLYPHLCRHLRGQVLDVGCGVGDMLRYRKDTTGVDINPMTVEWCRSQGLNAHVMRPDELPFPDRSFEGVILDNVLEHIENPGPLLGEVQRVLHPEGTLLVGVPGLKGYASDPDHKIFYDAEGLKATLAGAGFLCTRILPMPLDWAWLSTHMRQYCLYGIFIRERSENLK